MFKKYKLKKINKQLRYTNAMIRKYVSKDEFRYMKYIKIRDELIIKRKGLI